MNNQERSEPLGVRYARTDPSSAAAFSFRQSESDPSSWTIVPARSTEEPARRTDRALLAEGYVTVTVLDADRTVARREVRGVVALIRDLNHRPAHQH